MATRQSLINELLTEDGGEDDTTVVIRFTNSEGDLEERTISSVGFEDEDGGKLVIELDD